MHAYDKQGRITGKTITNTAKQAKDNPLIELLAALGGGGASSAIEAQEKRGQSEAVQSELLPTMGLSEYLPGGAYGALGFQIHEQVAGDDMFTRVTLPAGWKRQATDHSMWVDIVDEKGRKRSSFFYKAAFYDRNAHMSSPNTRYRTQSGDYKLDKQNKNEILVIDTTKATWNNDGSVCDEAVIHRSIVSLNEGEKSYEMSDRNSKLAKEWLDTNYPLHRDFAAYWD